MTKKEAIDYLIEDFRNDMILLGYKSIKEIENYIDRNIAITLKVKLENDSV